jgi:LytS/YehU family sensor histidine kinase
VFDNGVGLPELLQHGAGLENVQSRLVALYGDSGSLTISENELGGTTARLEIPR